MSRLALLRGLYLCLFGALGVFHPYLALLLRHRGIDPGWVALLLAVFPVLRIAVPTLLGWLADRRKDRVGFLRGLAVGGVLAALLLAAWRDLAGAFVGLVLLGCLHAPLYSLLDAVALAHVAETGDDWGRLRSLGSLGFLLAAGLGGLAWDRFGIEAAPVGLALCLAGFLALSLALPRRDGGEVAGEVPPLREALRSPTVRAVCAVATLHFTAHSGYDLYFSVHMESLGHSTRVTGAAWSFGVACELLLLTQIGRIARVTGVRALVVLGAVVGAVRFATLGALRDPAALVALQSLHALTFGAWFYGSIRLVDAATPASLRASAQGVFTAAVFGVGFGLGALLWGQVVGEFGTQAMLRGMAGLELVAALTAALTLPRAAEAR